MRDKLYGKKCICISISYREPLLGKYMAYYQTEYLKELYSKYVSATKNLRDSHFKIDLL
jgi:hypothetical protein